MSAPAESNKQRLLAPLVFAVFEIAMTSEMLVVLATIKSGCEEDGNCVRDKCVLLFASRSCCDTSDGVFATSLKSNNHVSRLSRHSEWWFEDRTSVPGLYAWVYMVCISAKAKNNAYIIFTTCNE